MRGVFTSWSFYVIVDCFSHPSYDPNIVFCIGCDLLPHGLSARLANQIVFDYRPKRALRKRGSPPVNMGPIAPTLRRRQRMALHGVSELWSAGGSVDSNARKFSNVHHWNIRF